MSDYLKFKDLPKDARYAIIIQPRGYGIIRFLADRKKKGGKQKREP